MTTLTELARFFMKQRNSPCAENDASERPLDQYDGMSEFCDIVFQKLRSLSENTHISFLVCKSQPWIWGITLHGVQNIASDLGEDIPRSEYYAWNSGHVFPRSEFYAWNSGHVFPRSELYALNLGHDFPRSEFYAWNLGHVFPRSELSALNLRHVFPRSELFALNLRHDFPRSE